MADDPRTDQKEQDEEEEEQEGKVTDSTISARWSPSQKASQTVSGSDQNDAPDSAQNVFPLATQNGSGYTLSGSPNLRKTPSKSQGISTTSPSLRRTPSRIDEPRKSDVDSATGSILRKSPSKSLGISSVSQSLNNTPIGSTASPRAGASSRSIKLEDGSLKGPSETESGYRLPDGQSEADISRSVLQQQSAVNIIKNNLVSRKATAKVPRKDKNVKGQARDHHAPGCGSSRLFERRSPFVHNPPYPEERRVRVSHPQCPKDYIINFREDLADFQESHGLPRTRDYSFLSLGLSLAQETGRAIYSVVLMIIELFPVIPIISLILRFALDKVIEIFETDGTVPRIKKTVLFTIQIIIIMIPLWILVATIIIPMFYLILSIFRRLFHLSGRKLGKAKTKGRPNPRAAEKGKNKKMSCI